jgi:(2Fe-2S) ferredoxin
MKKPTHHILVCNSFRMAGAPQGVCHTKGSGGLMQTLEEEILDRGLDAIVSATGCLKVCDRGPALVIYPQNYWYGNVTPDAIAEILDALENNAPCEKYLIA